MQSNPLTVPEIAHEIGVTDAQVRYAVQAGDLAPIRIAGRMPLFAPEQLDELRAAAQLVALGVGLVIALRIVRAGWAPPRLAA
jgi:hypothetical protein